MPATMPMSYNSDLPVFDARGMSPPALSEIDGMSTAVFQVVSDSELNSKILDGRGSTMLPAAMKPDARVYLQEKVMLPTVLLGDRRFFVVNQGLLTAAQLNQSGSLTVPIGRYGSIFNPNQYEPENMFGSKSADYFVFIVLVVFVVFVFYALLDRRRS